MRLLLLLYAIVSAVAGITGSRVAGAPAPAHATPLLVAAPVTVAAPASMRPAAPAFATTPPVRIAVRPPVPAIVARLLYAERRRE